LPAYTGREGTPRDEEGDRIKRPFLGGLGLPDEPPT